MLAQTILSVALLLAQATPATPATNHPTLPTAVPPNAQPSTPAPTIAPTPSPAAMAAMRARVSANPAGATIMSHGISLHVLIPVIAARGNHQYRILPGTPDITEHFSDRTNDEFAALKRVLAPDGLSLVLRDNIIYVGTAPQLDATLHTTIAKTVIISTNGVSPASITSNIGAFAPAGVVMIPDARNNAIIVRGTAEAVDAVQTALAGLQTTPYATYRIQLKNGISPADAVRSLNTLSPPIEPATLVPDVANSQILVYGTADYYKRVLDQIAFVDQPLAQVFYSISIYEVDPDSFDSIRGVKIGQSQINYQAVGNTAVAQAAAPNNGSLFTGFPALQHLNIAAQLDALESKGQAQILRRADLLTTNGHAATTDYLQNTGFLVPNSYTGINEPRSVQTGVLFTVTPYIGNGTITTDLKTTISDVTGVGPSGLPDTVSRDNQTQVVTAPDDSILISGLYADDKLDNRQGIPPFNHFFLGRLLDHHTYTHRETELVAILTPHLIHGLDRHVPVSYPNIPASVITNGLQTPPTPAPKH